MSLQKFAVTANPGKLSVVGVCLSPQHPEFLSVVSKLWEERICFTFLPPTESSEYLENLCHECSVEFVLTYENGLKRWNLSHVRSIDYYEDVIFGKLQTSETSDSKKEGPSLAYVIRTSGSTGTPKIVRVPHCCIEPNIDDFLNIFQVTSSDEILLCSPLTFDPSIVEIGLASRSGAKLIVADDSTKRNPEALATFIFEQHAVTILQMTPSLLMRFSKATLETHLFGENSKVRVLALGFIQKSHFKKSDFEHLI